MTLFNHVLLALTLATIITGCSSNTRYFTYTNVTSSVNHTNSKKIIPIWTDSSFTSEEKKSISLARNEWNYVLNNQITLVESGTFTGFEEADEILAGISRSDIGCVLLKFSENHALIKGLGNKEALAITVLNGHAIIVIFDRLATRSLKNVIMHEIGHILGAQHVNFASLMNPRYSNKQYDCIDKVTVAQVAEHNGIMFNSVNYCVTPNFE